MNEKIVLTSCGIKNKILKEEFKKLLNKPVENIKVLYITTAIEGEDISDFSWVDKEFNTILDLGIKKENIEEYKLDYEVDLSLYDIIYMMGGNTFYLLKKIKDKKFDIKLKKAIDNGIIYVGSSAGSVILGKTIELSLPYDKNNVNLTDFTGLSIVDGIIIPHANRKKEFISEKKELYKHKFYPIYDEHGIIIFNNELKVF